MADTDSTSSTYEEIEREVDEFDTAFQSAGNAPMVRAERAIIKTYLVWRTRRHSTKDSADAT